MGIFRNWLTLSDGYMCRAVAKFDKGCLGRYAHSLNRYRGSLDHILYRRTQTSVYLLSLQTFLGPYMACAGEQDTEHFRSPPSIRWASLLTYRLSSRVFETKLRAPSFFKVHHLAPTALAFEFDARKFRHPTLSRSLKAFGLSLNLATHPSCLLKCRGKTLKSPG